MVLCYYNLKITFLLNINGSGPPPPQILIIASKFLMAGAPPAPQVAQPYFDPLVNTTS